MKITDNPNLQTIFDKASKIIENEAFKKTIEKIEIEVHEIRNKHGYSLKHDIINNGNGQLKNAAIALLLDSAFFPLDWQKIEHKKEVCEKMKSKSYRQRLIIATSLLVCEISRLENK